MNIQDIITYGIIALSAVLIILRVKRSFFPKGKEGVQCTDCPIYKKCNEGKEGNPVPAKKCPSNQKSTTETSCNCK